MGRNDLVLSSSQAYICPMQGCFKIAVAAAIAMPLIAVQPLQAGESRHNICKKSVCLKKSKKVRKALDQQEFLQPIMADRFEPILVPPLQGPLIPRPELPQFEVGPP
jgi:hypothetical protein